MILLDHEKGTFKLINFYERRISEILPELLLVLCLSLYGIRLARQRRTWITSLSFCSFNVLFWMKKERLNRNTSRNIRTFSLSRSKLNSKMYSKFYFGVTSTLF